MTLEARLTALAQAIGVDVKLLTGNIGSLASLTTSNKSSLVAALNELKAAVAGASGINDAAPSSSSTYSSSKIDSQISAAVSALINGAPTALDTLKELADQLASDESATAGLVTAISLRVRVDSAQAFNAAQMAQGRSNLGAQDAASIGNADRDFAGDYTAAKA